MVSAELLIWKKLL